MFTLKVTAIVLSLIAVQLSSAMKSSLRHTRMEESMDSTLAELLEVPAEQASCRHNCTFCLDEVYPRTVENCTVNDEVTVRALPCKHFLNYHNKCFKQVVVEAAELPEVLCSMCGQSIHSTPAIQAILEYERAQIPIKKLRKMESDTGIIMEQVFRKWSGITKIGSGAMECGSLELVTVMRCAFHVLANPSEKDHVSPLMHAFHADQDLFFTKLLEKSFPTIGFMHRFPAYMDDFGRIISLAEAFRSAYHFQNGERIYKKLQHIEKLLSEVSHEDVSQAFSAFSEVEKFKFEGLFIRDVFTGSFYNAVHLLCIPSLSVEHIRARLSEVNQGFLNTKHQVDPFLDSYYPHLVEFKNVGMFNPDMEFMTPHYLASMALNPSIGNSQNWQEMNAELYELNTGVQTIPKNMNVIIFQNYGHCQEVLQEVMQNVPGEGVTVFQAMRYVANKNLLIDYKTKWIQAIKNHLSLRGCRRIEQSSAARLPLLAAPNSNNIQAFLRGAP